MVKMRTNGDEPRKPKVRSKRGKAGRAKRVASKPKTTKRDIRSSDLADPRRHPQSSPFFETKMKGPFRFVTAGTHRRKVSNAVAFSAGLQKIVESNAALTRRAQELAKEVSFTVTTTTRSQQPIQAARGRMSESSLDAFRPVESLRDKAINRLESLGFKVVRVGRFGITVRGPAGLVKEVVGEPLMLMRQLKSAAARAVTSFAAETLPPQVGDLFLAPTSTLSCQPKVDATIDHFVFAPPALLFSTPAPVAPATAYHSLSAALLRQHLHAPTSGALGQLTGAGINVGVVDTGFDTAHPFYVRSGVSFSAHASPGGPPGNEDLNGHGTAVVSNVFALAPGAAVHGVRQANPPYQDAIETAVDTAGADIISCSWGWDSEQSFPVLEATLRAMVEEEGKIVVFASGNGQYAWPGSMPSVISVGGVFADAAGQFEASDYASGFMSSLYPQRQVPDVCGLCGQGPRGVYIPMPCPFGCVMDHEFTGTAFPNGDGTAAIDGWVIASGTSSAAPQVAGVLALLLEGARAKGATLTNTAVRDLLQQSSRNVSRGRNAFGFPATTAQPNGAVGWGLVDTAALLQLAQARNLI